MFNTFLAQWCRLWNNVKKKCGRVRQDTDDNIIRRMRFLFLIIKDTDTPSGYVILIAFPWQQWLSEGASFLRLYVNSLPSLFSIWGGTTDRHHCPLKAYAWPPITNSHFLLQVTHWHSPRFHAYYPTANSYPGIVGEMLSAGIGCIGFNWVRPVVLLTYVSWSY